MEESRRRRRRRRSFSDEISRRGAADEEEDAEGLGLCFCFETGFFLGAIWPRAGVLALYRLIVSGDGVLGCRVPE